MEMLLAVAIVVGFYMAWNIGANDVANSMADAVGSKALTVFWAVILASVFEFAGAFLVGSHVTDTVRKGIIDPTYFAGNPQALAVGLVCALLASSVWLNIASLLGVPVSTTHSIVGAIAGFGILGASVGHVHWGTLGQIVASWFISPFAGGLIAFGVFKLITRGILAKELPIRAAITGVPICAFFTLAVVTLGTVYKGLKNLKLDLSGFEALLVSVAIGAVGAAVVRVALSGVWRGKEDLPFEEQLSQVEKLFMPMVIFTSCSVAFSHGANDVANAIGPLAAVVDIVKTNAVSPSVGVPLWVLALGGAGIVAGLATFGYRVMKTIGEKITEISPSRGVAADLAATATVLTCSQMGLPVSTTHTLVGAITGVGLARGLSSINRGTLRIIVLSWFVTLPAVAVLTMGFYLLARWATGI